MKIFKYTLPIMNTPADPKDGVIKMPVLMPKANILSVQNQCGEVAIWAEVEPTSPALEREFLALLTGQEVVRHPNWVFIGTVQVASLVFHIYDTLGFKVHPAGE